MAKRKYTGPWDMSRLRLAIESGKTYVECESCGELVDNWIPIINDECNKCGKSLGVRHHCEAQVSKDCAKQTKRDTWRFHNIKKMLYNGRGCVIFSDSKATYILKGQEAWESFLHSPKYSCLKCNCGYHHFLNVVADINFVSDLYDVRRDTGQMSPNNWSVSFQCQSCGKGNYYRHTTIYIRNIFGWRAFLRLILRPFLKSRY
jgi:predicted RNA-binding Zn-ribbon protein involved in translation (DUF1610 family)